MDHYKNFYQLHQQQNPLILANAWNAKSAQLIEKAGFEAVATSSGAIAGSLGYPDGEKIPFAEMLYMIQRIRTATTLPLTADMERGYSDDLTVLTDNIQKLIDAGVCGINLEDAQGEEIYLRKLQSIKNYLVKTGQQLFLNARTDVFLQKLPAPFETVVRRAKLYQDAGADGLFVTGVSDVTVIKNIASATPLPLNIVGSPTLFSVETLAESGVKRISMAGHLYNATYSPLEKKAQAIKAERSFKPLS
jgi:2-methylisocitrate lyase-like PEP mutase family enzyme